MNSLSKSEDCSCYGDVLLFVDWINQSGIKSSFPYNWGQPWGQGNNLAIWAVLNKEIHTHMYEIQMHSSIKEIICRPAMGNFGSGGPLSYRPFCKM